jgi:hypothetical protein
MGQRNAGKSQDYWEGANGPLTPEADEVFITKGTLVVPDMYLNAGGVTVSYFEWLKNLSHVRYGRMEKRFTENLNHHILGQIEELTNKIVSDRERQFIMHGPDEVDLVYSGLEETMITATREIMDTWKSNPQIPRHAHGCLCCSNQQGWNVLCGVGNLSVKCFNMILKPCHFAGLFVQHTSQLTERAVFVCPAPLLLSSPVATLACTAGNSVGHSRGSV